METLISNKEAYLTLFKLLPWEEQKAVYEMISELLEDIEDGLLIEERKNEPTIPFGEFVKELQMEGLYEKV
jgi:hypothetical protein